MLLAICLSASTCCRCEQKKVGRKPHLHRRSTMTNRDERGITTIMLLLKTEPKCKNALRAYPEMIPGILLHGQAIVKHMARWGSIGRRTPWEHKRNLSLAAEWLHLTWRASNHEVVFCVEAGQRLFTIDAQGHVIPYYAYPNTHNQTFGRSFTMAEPNINERPSR